MLVNEAAELAGWEPATTIAALAGSSPGSTAPLAALDAIAAAVAADPNAAALLAADGDGEASSAVDELRASSPTVRQAIDAHLDEFAIPAVVGAGTATTDVPDGAQVRVDGNEGTITLL